MLFFYRPGKGKSKEQIGRRALLISVAASLLFTGLSTRLLALENAPLISDAEVSATQQRLAAADPWINDAFHHLISEAQTALRRPMAAPAPMAADTANDYGHDVVFLATAYRLTGERPYAEHAAEVLLRLAQGFDASSSFITDNTSLDFCVVLLPLIQGFSLMRPFLPPKDIKTIQDKLLAPAAEAIRANEYKGSERRLWSNHRTWQNAAVGLAGFALGRTDLVDWAIENPEGGFKAQIANAFGEDGIHWEGSPRYALYALVPFSLLAEASATSGGQNLWDYQAPNGNRLENLFQGLISTSEANLRLPNVNARQQENLADFGEIIELFYKHYPKPEYAWLLAHSRRNPTDRPWSYGLEALRVTGNPPPAGVPPQLNGFLHKAIGWVTLRAGKGSAMGGSEPLYALFKYSRYIRLSDSQGTAHEHADKGLLEVRANGRQWLAARSRNNTHDPLYAGFDRQTLAKNTVVVDYTSQPGAQGPYDSEGVSGVLIFADQHPLIKVAQASIDAAYKLGYRRMIAAIGDPAEGSPALYPPYVIDLFRVADKSAHTFDYVLRAGESSFVFGDTSLTGFAPAEAGARGAGYQYLQNIESAQSKESFFVEWRATDSATSEGFRIHFLESAGDTRLLRASAPGVTSDTRFAHVIARREKLSNTTFRTVLEPYQGTPKLSVESWLDSEIGTVLEIQGASFRDFYGAIYPDRGTLSATSQKTHESLEVDGKYGFVRITGKRISIYGDVRRVSIRKPKGLQTPEAFYNGAPVHLREDNGYWVYDRRRSK